MVLLKDKHVEVLYLEEKKRINDTERNWFRNFSWLTLFNSSPVQSATALVVDAVAEEDGTDDR